MVIVIFIGLEFKWFIIKINIFYIKVCNISVIFYVWLFVV